MRKSGRGDLKAPDGRMLTYRYFASRNRCTLQSLKERDAATNVRCKMEASCQPKVIAVAHIVTEKPMPIPTQICQMESIRLVRVGERGWCGPTGFYPFDFTPDFQSKYQGNAKNDTGYPKLIRIPFPPYIR